MDFLARHPHIVYITLMKDNKTGIAEVINESKTKTNSVLHIEDCAIKYIIPYSNTIFIEIYNVDDIIDNKCCVQNIGKYYIIKNNPDDHSWVMKIVKIVSKMDLLPVQREIIKTVDKPVLHHGYFNSYVKLEKQETVTIEEDFIQNIYADIEDVYTFVLAHKHVPGVYITSVQQKNQAFDKVLKQLKEDRLQDELKPQNMSSKNNDSMWDAVMKEIIMKKNKLS